MAVIPVPTTRTSDLLLRDRLINQLRNDQRSLLQVQDQLSTGRRIGRPSDDSAAALRAIGLQRLIERKEQAKTNLQTSESYLGSTDTALTAVSDVLISIRGIAVSISGTTTTDVQREAAAEEVLRALQHLVDIGNRSFRGRRLFAGANTAQKPFDFSEQFVAFAGNSGSLSSFADIDFLVESNLPADDVFGVFSEEVRGTVDLNPILTAETRLDDLHGGLGITQGSILVSDSSSGSTIDLSSAETVGDIVNLIQDNPPSGRKVIVRITSQGLTVDLDDTLGGSLQILEVAEGTTANDLGILETQGVGTAPLVGRDLNPQLRLTTSLRDILGVRSSTYVTTGGANNDFFIEANQRGALFNDVTIQFVDDPAVTKGNETVVYDDSDPANKTLTFNISEGNTDANDIVDAINVDPTVGALFTARIDDTDTSVAFEEGKGLIPVTSTALTSGGSGIEFDQDSGFQLVNGGQTYDINIQAAETIEDILNTLNGVGADVLAEINRDGNGINVRSRLSGADLFIGENGGTTATELGIRSLTANTSLDDLNYGAGVRAVDGVDFTIRRTDGVDLDIDVSSTDTIGDVIDLINNHADNLDPATSVLARLTSVGNGIELVDDKSGGVGPLTVTVANTSPAAADLGLVSNGENQSTATLSGTTQTLTAADTNPTEVNGIYNTLFRLHNALISDDQVELERSAALLSEDLDLLSLARAELGARQQALDVLKQRLDSEEVELRSALSLEIDVDLIEAVSDFAVRQQSMEAALRAIGQTFQLTLLNFI